ncbi:MAG: glycosyltransferase [Gemmatimonadota bacterium]
MRILVDLVPVSRGGGLQNALNLWREIGRSGSDHQWHAFVRPGVGFDHLPTGSHQTLEVVEARGLPARLRVENVRIPDRARSFGADVVFTPMGAGPLRAPVPRVIGWHDSTVAYPESALWRQASLGFRAVEPLRQRYAAAAAQGAARICVQTATMARRLGRVWGIEPERFHVVPNGPSAFLVGEAPAAEPPRADPLRILVIGEPKPSKNLEILPRVAAALSRRSLPPWEMIVTVGPPGGPWLAPFDAALTAAPDAERHIRRVGPVPHAELGELYRGAAVVLLPSLLESFSATYVEAMHFGVPLVTSDLDFARDICGRAALYADPLDPDALAERLARALTDAQVRSTLRAEGFATVAALPDWRARLQRYVDACAAAVGAPEATVAVGAS